jgi:ATP-dependent DNA ligase
MVARSGRLPHGPGWFYGVKWDGFRAIVCTHDGLRVRSRRGRNLAALVPELAGAARRAHARRGARRLGGRPKEQFREAGSRAGKAKTSTL